jgi:hypothetical protein
MGLALREENVSGEIRQSGLHVPYIQIVFTMGLFGLVGINKIILILSKNEQLLCPVCVMFRVLRIRMGRLKLLHRIRTPQGVTCSRHNNSRRLGT